MIPKKIQSPWFTQFQFNGATTVLNSLFYIQYHLKYLLIIKRNQLQCEIQKEAPNTPIQYLQQTGVIGVSSALI